MKESQHWYQQIESYLLNQMSVSERTAFEAEIRSNDELAEQVRQQELEHKVMEAMIEKDLLADLQEWEIEDEHNNKEAASDASIKQLPKSNNRFNLRTLLAIAATLLLLVSIFWWFQQRDISTEIVKNILEDETPLENQNQTNPEEVVPETLIEDPSKNIANESEVPTQRSEDETPTSLPETQKQTPPKNIAKQDPPSDQNEIDPNLQEVPQQRDYIALAETVEDPWGLDNSSTRNVDDIKTYEKAHGFYTKKQYATGINLLKKQISQGNASYNDTLYLANGLYNNGQYSEALPYLQYIASRPVLDADEAAWRLALAQLKSDDLQQAMLSFQAIAQDEGHPHSAQATKLLKLLSEY